MTRPIVGRVFYGCLSGHCGVPFASKPAPTLDLHAPQIPCGSGLAREGAATVYQIAAAPNAATIRRNSGASPSIRTCKPSISRREG
ncbi:hypothetical protein C1X65_21775 [Pseudomonas sp. FW305-70]|nr:hypothetical protein C1X65_21775 [Pseudomonas sp. FW305-70]